MTDFFHTTMPRSFLIAKTPMVPTSQPSSAHMAYSTTRVPYDYGSAVHHAALLQSLLPPMSGTTGSYSLNGVPVSRDMWKADSRGNTPASLTPPSSPENSLLDDARTRK